MAIIPDGHVESVDELVDMMARAISPHAYSDHSSEQERILARIAARRCLLVCAPIILTEAALVIEAHCGPDTEAGKIILGLKDLF